LLSFRCSVVGAAVGGAACALLGFAPLDGLVPLADLTPLGVLAFFVSKTNSARTGRCYCLTSIHGGVKDT